ncbi:MAG TPA: GNAT family N-acetyltransferase [Gemmatimonadales bacterium]|nr:GNAT family N-acetyltransferase [Gemmatimonadales bacterium]
MSVTHAPDRHRFVVPTPHGEAELAYRLRPDGAMDLLHTFVPEAARGGTLASDLVSAAVAYARTHGLKLVATCPYVQSWLKRHQEAGELFVK